MSTLTLILRGHWLCWLFLFSFAMGRGAPVGPEPAAVREFAAMLFRDYQQRQAQAVLARFDERATLARILRVPPASVDNPEGDWKRILPSAQLFGKAFNAFPTMVFYRFILAHDERQLQCEFVNDRGGVLVAVFTLCTGSIGTVRICDVQIAGHPLPYSRILRHQWLLQNYSVPNVLDQDEISLRAFGQNHGTAIRDALRACAEQRYDACWKTWVGLPEDLKKYPIWQYYFAELASLNCTPARRELERQVRGGAEVDPMVRFLILRGGSDRAATLRAIDDVLRLHQDPVVFRCTKANLLLEAGKLPESYEIFRETVDLTPFAGIAYVGAIQAAVAMKRPLQAVAMLRRWELVLNRPDIAKILELVPTLAEFRAGPEYSNWMQGATSPVQ